MLNLQLFPGLIEDSLETVTLVLSVLKDRVLTSTTVTKTVKMKLFGVHNWKLLLRLYKWKGPQRYQSQQVMKSFSKVQFSHLFRSSDEDISDEVAIEHAESLEKVSSVLTSLLDAALTSSKLGLVFFDPAVGTSGRNMNLLLLGTLQSLEKPWEKPEVAEVVARALRTCPDQLRTYLQVLEGEWQPRDGESWFQVFKTRLKCEGDL